VALAYVMNLSGQTVTIGKWAAGAGGFFPFLSSVIGWLGTAITGSYTSSNLLFGALQVAAAKSAHLNQLLLAGSNSSGGVLGMGGQEGELFRKVLKWSLLPVLIMAVLAYLQSTSVLSWMVP
jgi:lactate permease